MGRQYGISIMLPFMMLATGVFAGQSVPMIAPYYRKCLQMSILVAKKEWQRGRSPSGHGNHPNLPVEVKMSGIHYSPTSKRPLSIAIGTQRIEFQFNPYIDETDGQMSCELERFVSDRSNGQVRETLRFSFTDTEYWLRWWEHHDNGIREKHRWFRKSDTAKENQIVMQNLTLVGLLNRIVRLSSRMISELQKDQLDQKEFLGLPYKGDSEHYKLCKEFEKEERKDDVIYTYKENEIYFFPDPKNLGEFRHRLHGGRFVRSEDDSGLIYWTEYKRDPRLLTSDNAVVSKHVFVVLDEEAKRCSRIKLERQ